MIESTWLVDTSSSILNCCHWIQASGVSVTNSRLAMATAHCLACHLAKFGI